MRNEWPGIGFEANDNWNSAIDTLTIQQGKSLDFARDDNGAKRNQNSAALLLFMRRTNPFEPLEPIEPAPPLSQTIKGRPAPRANPEPQKKQSTSGLLLLLYDFQLL